MRRVAAVDCGTNSLRLLVSDVDVDGWGKTDVHREMRVVRLGEGVDATGALSPEALARTRAALSDYAGLVRDLGVQRTRMVATSATRDASNRDVFVAMVQDVLGVAPEVLEGAREAELSFAGATRDLPTESRPFLVVDIGGGSTEVVFGTNAVQAASSVDVGCVRLTERHLTDDPPTPAQVQAAEADVQQALTQVAAQVPVGRAQTVVGLAGSVTTVAALARGLPAYQPERIHLSRLSAEQVRDTTASLLEMSRAERARLPVMHPGRVDVIGGGALVLRAIMDRFELPEVLVSEQDILDGIAWSAASRPAP